MTQLDLLREMFPTDESFNTFIEQKYKQKSEELGITLEQAKQVIQKELLSEVDEPNVNQKKK